MRLIGLLYIKNRSIGHIQLCILASIVQPAHQPTRSPVGGHPQVERGHSRVGAVQLRLGGWELGGEGKKLIVSHGLLTNVCSKIRCPFSDVDKTCSDPPNFYTSCIIFVDSTYSLYSVLLGMVLRRRRRRRRFWVVRIVCNRT